jgi:hypothetical protein
MQEINQDLKKEEVKTEARPVKERDFRPGKLFIGVLIIFVGLIYLLKNAGVISHVYFDFAKLWPVIIILIGLSMLSARGMIPRLIWIIAVIITCAGISLIIFTAPRGVRALRTEPISIAPVEGLTSAQLNIRAGAGKITVTGGSDKIASGNLESNVTGLTVSSANEGNVQKVVIEEKGGFRFFGPGLKNNLTVAAAKDVPMSMNVDTGASDMNLDLSDTKTENLNINTGASQLYLTLGDKVASGKVTVSAGASSIKIFLPRTAGAKIAIDSGLTSKDLIDFKQTDSKNYISNNYDSAQQKYDIILKLGASSLEVNWR